ncbi:hypothetical protein F5Y10DRAFT_224479 [Nemania abortiva]|nr:hypothetical protein F5Y10DRAFT_224479 [Nemania abortiva]
MASNNRTPMLYPTNTTPAIASPTAFESPADGNDNHAGDVTLATQAATLPEVNDPGADAILAAHVASQTDTPLLEANELLTDVTIVAHDGGAGPGFGQVGSDSTANHIHATRKRLIIIGSIGAATILITTLAMSAAGCTYRDILWSIAMEIVVLGSFLASPELAGLFIGHLQRLAWWL